MERFKLICMYIQKKLTVKLPLILNYKSKWIEINEHWQITTFHPCLTGLSEKKNSTHAHSLRKKKNGKPRKCKND